MPFRWILWLTQWRVMFFSFLKSYAFPLPIPSLSSSLSLFLSPSFSLSLSPLSPISLSLPPSSPTPLLFSFCFQVCSLGTKARICAGVRQPTFFPVGLCIAPLVTLRAKSEWVCNSFWSWFAARRYSLCGASLLSWSADPGFPLPFPFWPATEAQHLCLSLHGWGRWGRQRLQTSPWIGKTKTHHTT